MIPCAQTNLDSLEILPASVGVGLRRDRKDTGKLATLIYC